VTPDDLGALFETFTRTAFRLEGRDDYNVPDEADRLAAFLEGRELPARTPSTDAWLGLVANATAAGRRMVRVRVVGMPVTDYTRFELAVYPENIAAGEQVRLVERDSLPQLSDNSWDEDFWLFDGQTVAVLRYDAEGRFLGVAEGTDIDRYRRIEREALARSVEFGALHSRAALIER
jgi:hypothetical protein